MHNLIESPTLLKYFKQILFDLVSDLRWLTYLESYIQDLERVSDLTFPQHDILHDCCKLLSQIKAVLLPNNSSILTNIDNSLNSCLGISWSELISGSRLASDITWQQLNLGVWKNVDIRTKYLYSYSILINVYAQLGELRDSLPSDNTQFCNALQQYHAALRRVLRKCDSGLMMGAPVAGRRLNTVATAIHHLLVQLDESSSANGATDGCSAKRLKTELVDSPEALAAHADLTRPLSLRTCPEQFLIPRVHFTDLSLERFRSEFMDTRRPLIIEGLLDCWPAFQTSGSRRWSLDYLRRTAGYRFRDALSLSSLLLSYSSVSIVGLLLFFVLADCY